MGKYGMDQFLFRSLGPDRDPLFLELRAGDFRNFIILRRQDLRQRLNHDNFRSERVAPAPTTSMASGVRFGIIASK
jgi:hypothetical protein